jgi:hypothetical protein
MMKKKKRTIEEKRGERGKGLIFSLFTFYLIIFLPFASTGLLMYVSILGAVAYLIEIACILDLTLG